MPQNTLDYAMLIWLSNKLHKFYVTHMTLVERYLLGIIRYIFETYWTSQVLG